MIKNKMSSKMGIMVIGFFFFNAGWVLNMHDKGCIDSLLFNAH